MVNSIRPSKKGHKFCTKAAQSQHQYSANSTRAEKAAIRWGLHMHAGTWMPGKGILGSPGLVVVCGATTRGDIQQLCSLILGINLSVLLVSPLSLQLSHWITRALYGLGVTVPKMLLYFRGNQKFASAKTQDI